MNVPWSNICVVLQIHNVNLLWVPAHNNVERNETVDSLARNGSNYGPCPAIRLTYSTQRSIIRNSTKPNMLTYEETTAEPLVPAWMKVTQNSFWIGQDTTSDSSSEQSLDKQNKHRIGLTQTTVSPNDTGYENSVITRKPASESRPTHRYKTRK